MMMKGTLLPAVLLLAIFVLGSAREEKSVQLTNTTVIMDNGWMELTCGAKTVGLSSDVEVVQLELARVLTFSVTEQKIASYRPASQPNPGLSIGKKFKDDKRWMIKGHGQEPSGPADSYYITALVNKTQCLDRGDYRCYVNYTDKNTTEQKQIEGWMILLSIAEITPIELNATNNNRTNTNDVQKDDVITVDCYVKGPLIFNLVWKKDGKVIGVDVDPPEVIKVKKYGGYPLSGGDCPQNRYRSTLIFKARPDTFRYQCAWKYGIRNGSAVFDMASAKWTWSNGNKGGGGKSKGFNIWYVIAPVVSVVGLGLIVAVIFVVVSRYRNRANLQGEKARLIN